jgi:hypothetical protein
MNSLGIGGDTRTRVIQETANQTIHQTTAFMPLTLFMALVFTPTTERS